MSADELGQALRAAGVSCRVEAHERLALLVPDEGDELADADVRERVVALARAYGFTHAAVELPEGDDASDRASLSRD